MALIRFDHAVTVSSDAHVTAANGAVTTAQPQQAAQMRAIDATTA